MSGNRGAEGRGQRAEGQRAEGRGQRAEEGKTYVAGKIEGFRDLVVYQKAFELQQDIFTTTKKFPKEELYSLTDQIRRSSRSIGANLCEALQKRRYIAHFISKLSDSDGEQAETQHCIDTALACEYISPEIQNQLLTKCREVGKMLGSMIANPDKFCKSPNKSK
jgi:four helix bundle protein